MDKPTAKEIEEVGNAIARTDVRPDIYCSDNVAIMIVSEYERDGDCPEDELADDESGWKPWALAQEKALRDRMATAAIIALDKLRTKP